jgi:hypothetical protein
LLSLNNLKTLKSLGHKKSLRMQVLGYMLNQDLETSENSLIKKMMLSMPEDLLLLQQLLVSCQLTINN